MILEHTSGKYYEIVECKSSDRCKGCDLRGEECSRKDFMCGDLKNILNYNMIFKEVEL